MCNLSEVVLEKGIEQGMRQLIQQMRNNGKNTKEIADFCGIPMERVEEWNDNRVGSIAGDII